MSFRLFSALLWIVSTLSLVGIATFGPRFGWRELPLIGQLFSRPHPIDLVPAVLILILFAWVLIELAFKYRNVRRQHAANASFEQIMAESDQNRYQPKAFNLSEPRAIRRADLVIECSRRDASSLHEAVPAAAALDAGTLSASYGPLNVYAWILPVLGFIGTAVGMTQSIDGFRDALRTAGPGRLNQMAEQLGQTVIPGLAAAFETTILALTAALVTYFCTSALRAWDQEALDQLDRLCIVLLSRIPQPEGPEGKRIVSVLGQISDQLGILLQMPVALEAATRAMQATAAHLESSSGQLQSAGGEMNSASRSITTAITDVASAAKSIREAAERLRSELHAPQPAAAKKIEPAEDLASAIKALQEAVLRPITITMSRD